MMYKGYGLEADLVLHLDDGRYALIECKLGSREKREFGITQAHAEHTNKQPPLS